MGMLDGKVAIITGAATGIGRASAVAVRAGGRGVVMTDVGGRAGTTVDGRAHRRW